ncbi:MAG: NCLDV major capsid protein [Harvfovirus sp.]|uniref:NCLDV major capsid protein n=1 Tax=Harvfovirus sp. TaxID=2487768 RepID=A0A3G5A618_9VIRU|nr:MAG: NCLDV major capsid protein [Harvfovirus sp.]
MALGLHHEGLKYSLGPIKYTERWGITVQYHEVRLLFEFTDVNKLIVHRPHFDGERLWGPELRGLCMKEASLLVDYIYLDSVERRRFAQVGHEYLIEQVQFTGDETLTGNSHTHNLHYKSKLGFNHPVKELIWVIKNMAFTGDDKAGHSNHGHPFLAYADNEVRWETVALQEAANNIAAGMFRITPLIGVAPPESRCDLNCPATSIPLCSPCTFVDLPTSPVHVCRINIFTTCPNEEDHLNILRYPIVIGGPGKEGCFFNYADFLNEIQVNVCTIPNGPCVPATRTFTATVISHCLTVSDISVPLNWGSAPNHLVDFRYNTCNGVNPNDIYVIQPFNYGLRLDGKGNPVSEAGLQFNGQDRFDPRHGNYFNYVQPWQHHTHTPADGINVYSFALHPEQHQPTGTANLSRIDSSVLILRLADHVRHRFGLKPKLQIDLSYANLYVFAFSYNVLRVMSGMGGLAYSN